jgi:hypothetical protein
MTESALTAFRRGEFILVRDLDELGRYIPVEHKLSDPHPCCYIEFFASVVYKDDIALPAVT